MSRSRSRKKIKYFLIIIALVVVAMIFFIWHGTNSFVVTPGGGLSTSSASTTVSQASAGQPPAELSQTVTTPQVTINGAAINVEISTTTAAVDKGLSGRPSLAADDGMLFAFQEPAILRFWMPDMNFPLDMIWINSGAVVDISANVTTTFNPAAPVFYSPKKPAQYVIEVNAGFSAAHGIVPGDPVTFKNIPLSL